MKTPVQVKIYIFKNERIIALLVAELVKIDIMNS